MKDLLHSIARCMRSLRASLLPSLTGGVWGWVFLFILAACTSSIDDSSPSDNSSLVTVPINFAFAPDNDAMTRAPGDPGTYETLELPRYLYIYFVAVLPGGGTQVCKFGNERGEEISMSNPITTGTWTETTNTDVFPQTEGDKIYSHSGTYRFKVPSGVTLARVYAAASYEALTDPIVLGTSTEANVLAMTFDVTTGLRAHLQDLYSTPYNYNFPSSSTPYGDQYYGTVRAYASTPLNLMLYHVAAKVDVKWNVVEDKQDNYRISYIQARKLKQQNCLLFKPTENTWTSADDAANYSIDLLDGDIGQQWYGRQYFYTIPYQEANGKYNIHLHILKNGDDKTTYESTGYNLKLTKTLPAVFTPWIRADLRFSTDGIMTYGAGEIEKALD